jgi:hypothetical protein
MQTIRQFVQKHRITSSAQWADPDPQEYQEWPHTAYKVTLQRSRGAGRGGTRMTMPFKMGIAHTSEPSTEDVLSCLASDSAGYDNARSFEDWAGEYGFDLDDPDARRKCQKTYTQTRNQQAKLRRFLDDDLYEELLYSTEGL